MEKAPTKEARLSKINPNEQKNAGKTAFPSTHSLTFYSQP